MTKSRTYLQVKSLKNTIDGFILQDISFSIRDGEIVLLGGRNGSGKTSLLETLCFVEKPTDGNINFFDKNVFDKGLKSENLQNLKKYLGVQFQGDSLFKNLTVMETFELFSQNYGLKDVPNVVFDCPFLKDVLNKKITNLSEGKLQLVKFVLSIIHDPRMVFLDEPVSTLDGDTRSWIYEKIREMRSEKTSFLITLNSLWKIGNISDKLITLHDGRIYSVVDDFSEYYEGCLLKLPIDRDIAEVRCKPWVLNIVQKEKDSYYEIYSRLPMKSIIERSDLPYFEVRKVKLKDFYPGVSR